MNIHLYERWIRVIFGVILCSLAFVGPQNYWFLIGLLPIVTGLAGWCPPYALLGINTCGVRKKKFTTL